MEEQLLCAYLHLLAHPEVGPAKLARLLEQQQSLAALVSHAQSQLASQHNTDRATLREIAAVGSNSAGKKSSAMGAALDWQQKDRHHILVYESEDYPALLREIASPPPLLYAHGELSLLNTPAVAMVGSRKGSSYGIRHTYCLANALASGGFTVVSGLARGIDTAAHKGALSANDKTIAVIGTGIDKCYPAANKALQSEIEDKALVLSEFPLGSPPRPQHFPQRNRLISGLSLGTVVMEANLRSGSLITARTAMEQNRTVFAMPGPIDSKLSRGCHKLLREGAKLVEDAGDIGEELLESWHFAPDSHLATKSDKGTDNASKQRLEPKNISEHEQQILAAMTEPNMSMDSLLIETGMPLAKLNTGLLLLESKGLVVNQSGRLNRS